MEELLASIADDAMGEHQQLGRWALDPCTNCPLRDPFLAATAGLDLGMRVRIAQNGALGVIRHVGACHWAPGDWVGVELGECHDDALRTYSMPSSSLNSRLSQSQTYLLESMMEP